MELGIFAKTFIRPSLESTLDAVEQFGFKQIQFNLACAGLAPMPDRIETDIAQRIASETKARNINIAAVSGTFNMIHPNTMVREEGLNRLRTLASSCKVMGASVITLCTGTRDADNM